LTEIQRLAVESGLFDKKNLIISAPTNTGKTFIGELAALSTSTRREFGRSFFLVPLKALAEEMFEQFQRKYAKWGLRIAISTHDRMEFDKELAEYDMVIATYEKLYALLVRQPELLREIGLVVVDELQNVGDVSRGSVIEILLTRLLVSKHRPQVIGLSATIPNAPEVAEWLGATLLKTDKRDVELREGILYTGSEAIEFLDKHLKHGDFIYREFNTGKVAVEPNLNINDIGKITEMSRDEQNLIFVQSQRSTEENATLVANSLPDTNDTKELIEELDLRVESTPSTRTLRKVLLNGTAFHHAGLFPEERGIVEDGFRRGFIRVVCATTTLAAGVNTPAKNVIILSHRTWENRSLPIRDYKNMAGRAGRIRTKDNFGRSTLIGSNEKEMEMLWNEYVLAQPEPIKSQIPNQTGLGCSMLGLIVSGVCVTIEELRQFLRKTFFGYIYREKSAEEFRSQFDVIITKEVQDLIKNEFILEENGKIKVTELGRRCAEELLSPQTVLMFYKTLKDSENKIKYARGSDIFVEGFIHLCCCSKEATLLFEPKSNVEIDELRAVWEKNKEKILFKPKDETLFLRSFRTTRMLLRWIDGLPLNELRSYAPHGIIKRTAETTSWLLKGLGNIADKPLFEFTSEFHVFIEALAERVYYGVPTDALSVMRLAIPGVHRNRAIRLVEAGFKNIDDLTRTSVKELMSVNGISESLALRIKEHVEKFIEDDIARHRERQIRIALELRRSSNIIEQLYQTRGDAFARVCINLLKEIGLDALYIGNVGEHDVDGLVRLVEGNIVVECKRKERENITAREAEEVIGKGARYNPIANVTIGLPDFAESSIKNAPKAKVTLIKASLLGELLLHIWKGELDQGYVISLLKSKTYIHSLSDVRL